MIRRLALGLLLALSACNRHGVADVTLDADAAQRNTTAAKTIADLAAADDASQGPAPEVRDVGPAAKPEATPVKQDETDETPADEPDASFSNEE